MILNHPRASVAMPLIGTGDQGWPVAPMMTATLRAAVGWIRRGLGLGVLKIVVRSDDAAQPARTAFAAARQEIERRPPPAPPSVSGPPSGGPGAAFKYDVFLSYAHAQADIAQAVRDLVTQLNPRARVFHDRTSLYHDCRESNDQKLRTACGALAQAL